MMLKSLCLIVALIQDPAAPAASVSQSAAAASQSAVPAPAATETTKTETTEATKPEPTTKAATETTTEKHLLRYQFHPSQKLRYESIQKMTLDATVGEAKKVDVSEVRQMRLFTVSSIEPDGAAKLSMQFEKVWMQKQVDNDPPVQFDSSMKPTEVPGLFRPVAHSLKGSAVQYWISTVGASCYPKEDPQAIIRDKDEESINGFAAFNAPATRNDPGSFLMLLPETPVAAGESWKESIQVLVRGSENAALPVSILRTYRLDEIKDGVALVSFRSSVNTPLRGVMIKTQLIQATPSGKFRFDLKRGVMLSREFRYNETVIGALGPESVLTSKGTQTETLIEEAATAAVQVDARP